MRFLMSWSAARVTRSESRQLTRADLSMLREMKKELEAQINAESESCLLDDTYVAFFDGR